MRLLLAAITILTLAQVSTAGSPAFPWHATRPTASRPVGTVPARALSRPATTPVELLQPKQPYPYGWFGPTPTKHFIRSFGSSKNYTQWSLE